MLTDCQINDKNAQHKSPYVSKQQFLYRDWQKFEMPETPQIQSTDGTSSVEFITKVPDVSAWLLKVQ